MHTFLLFLPTFTHLFLLFGAAEIRLSSDGSRSDADLYQDKHTPRCQMVDFR